MQYFTAKSRININTPPLFLHRYEWPGIQDDCLLHNKCTKCKRRTITRHPLEHLKDAMRVKLQSDTGKATYNVRMSTVEPVHADVKYNNECYEFSGRGKKNANCQLLLYSILYNSKKMIKFSLMSTFKSSFFLFYSASYLVSSFFYQTGYSIL